MLAAVSIQRAGQARAAFNRSVGGAVGVVAGGAVGVGSGDQAVLAGFGGAVGRGVAGDLNARHEVPIGGSVWTDMQLPQNGVLVLTTGRLLVFAKAAMGLFSAKPKAAHADIPLAEVQRISDLVEASVAGMKSAQVAIGLRSGAVVRMEFPPPAVQNGTALMAELVRRLGGAGQ